MAGFSQNGWQPPTPQELRDSLQEFLKQNVPNYTARPADILSNLLDGGVAFGMYFVQQLQSYFNGYAPSYGDDFLLELRASEQGLRRKSSFKSSVDIQFTAPAFTIIPEQTPITGNNLPTYYTQESAVVGSTGIIILKAYCDDENIPQIGVGQLDQIGISLQNVTATNTSAPTQPQDEESFDDFAKRVQLAWSSPRGGSVSYLLSQLKGLDGVVQRATSLQVNSNGTYEVIIDGGDPLEIAWAMFNGGGILPNVFVSNPSQGQSIRTVTQNLTLNAQSIPFKFTRPLQVPLEILITLKTRGLSMTSEEATKITTSAMESYVNGLQLGESINQVGIQNAFLEAFLTNGITTANIATPSLTISVNNVSGGSSSPLSFDSDGFLQIQSDWYFTLSKFSVTLNA